MEPLGQSSLSALDLSQFDASQFSLIGTDGCTSGLVAVLEHRVERVPLAALQEVAKACRPAVDARLARAHPSLA